MDNVGFWLIERDRVKTGNFLISLMPKLIKFLAVVGTIAMILVGGGILSHNIDMIHHLFISEIPTILNEFIVGIVGGVIVLFVVSLVRKLFR